MVGGVAAALRILLARVVREVHVVVEIGGHELRCELQERHGALRVEVLRLAAGLPVNWIDWVPR